ncbi:hypothetical protein L1887_59858 [Cichorium endivia]|nr:hypothetical protein L1887_59858 [Cichorium endivia]
MQRYCPNATEKDKTGRLGAVEFADDLLVQRLGGEHLWRVEDLVHERRKRAVESIQLKRVGGRVEVGVEVDDEAVHVFHLVVALNVVGLFRTSVRHLLPAVALEDVERERVVRVEDVRAVLPDELRRHAVGLGRVGVVQIQRLLPVSVVGKAVRLARRGRVDEAVVDRVVKVETCQDVAGASAPCTLQRRHVVRHTDAICGLSGRARDEQRRRSD